MASATSPPSTARHLRETAALSVRIGDRALATARAQEDFRLVAHLLRWLAEVHADLDRPAEAERELAECSAMHRAIDDRLGEGYALQATLDFAARARSARPRHETGTVRLNPTACRTMSRPAQPRRRPLCENGSEP